MCGERTRYLTVYDYGQGGVWTWVVAPSVAELTARYPELTVVDERPEWLANDRDVRAVVLDDEADGFLRSIREGRTQ